MASPVTPATRNRAQRAFFKNTQTGIDENIEK